MTYTQTPMVDSTTGEIQHPIVIGDDYIVANNRGLVWTIDPITGYTLGQCTCWMALHYKGETTNLAQGSMALVSSKWELRFDITRAYTDALDPGWYQYSVEVKHGAYESTMVLSDCTVQLKRKWTDSATTTGDTIDCGFPDSVFDPAFGDAYDGGSP